MKILNNKEKKLRIAILISGRGSNMQALINACSGFSFPAEVTCVISNNQNSKGLLFAQELELPTFVVSNKPLDIDKVDNILANHNIDLVCLAGFMSIINADFLLQWKNKVINIHPSLLPSFKGLNAQKQALDAGVKISGCTVHYVSPEVDSGPIIIQAAVPVLEQDNVHTLSQRILNMEHICYPMAVKLIASKEVVIENNIVKSTKKLFLGVNS